MRVMVIVKASKQSEAGQMPSQQLLADMGKFNQALMAAGIMMDGGGLHPTSKGARVRFPARIARSRAARLATRPNLSQATGSGR